MELHYDGHTFDLADESDASTIFESIAEARRQALTAGSGALPTVEIALRGGRSVTLLVEVGTPIAIETTIGTPSPARVTTAKITR